MLDFIRKHAGSIVGVLSGWDRVLLRGTLARGRLNGVRGMMYYLNTTGVYLKHFVQHAKQMTQMLIEGSLSQAEKAGRPVEYLPSSKTSKEELAREILKDGPVQKGLICVLKCVEPCVTFEIRRNREAKKLELVRAYGKCQHLYHYYLDPEFGFMNARIQTWFPFAINICINGREWLGQKLELSGIAFERYDNSFPWIEDFERAQSLMDEMMRISWPMELNRVAGLLHPAHTRMFANFPVPYYWTIEQSEWATDICFRTPEDLAAIYPQLMRGAITGFSSKDVMRFLGKRPDGRFAGELVSDFKHRAEGIRVKHRMNGNSVKAYDKAGGRILRVETTINDPRPFKVFRPMQDAPEESNQWLRMRAGVADQHRRAEVSQKTNERYLDALASLDTTERLEQVVAPIVRPGRFRRKPTRALNPWSPGDLALLEFIARPEHLLAGFRNRDLAKHLFPSCAEAPTDKRKAAARTSYRIRLLRAHRLIVKLPKARCYRITKKGRHIVSAILLTQNATLKTLTAAAA
jgi:hypothetical protein